MNTILTGISLSHSLNMSWPYLTLLCTGNFITIPELVESSKKTCWDNAYSITHYMESIEIHGEADKLLMIKQLFFRQGHHTSKEYFRNTLLNISCKLLFHFFLKPLSFKRPKHCQLRIILECLSLIEVLICVR